MRPTRPVTGRLVVLEGPDAVGKSAISRAVWERLRAREVPCELLAFPGREPHTLGKLVYELHHDSRGLNVNSLTESSKQALHIAAHLDTIESRITPLLASGMLVLLDRFWWSTWVYGLVGGVSRHVLKGLIAVEKSCWGNTRPALAALITREAPLRGEPRTDRWAALAREYATLAKAEGRLYPSVEIRNDGSLADSVNAVVAALELHGIVTSERDGSRGRTDSTSKGLARPKMSTGADKRGPTVVSLSPAKPTEVLNTYWRFAAERQRIFFLRAAGEAPPWTKDPILATYKFTNAYRASDRVSQYLIRNVIYRDDLPNSHEEVFFRTILFKLFNKIETWQHLEQVLGPLTYERYRFDAYDRVLSNAMASGHRIYSAAYIMPTGGRSGTESRKHRLHLRLIERMMGDRLPAKLHDAPTMHAAYDLLLEYPTIGEFLAYQYVTDVNYSEITNFSEMEFVVPGPGALDGIRKCFSDTGGLGEPEVIRMMADIQEDEFSRLGLKFQSLWGRRLQLIDCQNLFCEVDKYARVAHPDISGISGRTRIKQKFSCNPNPVVYWYPPKWGINASIDVKPRKSLPGQSELLFG